MLKRFSLTLIFAAAAAVAQAQTPAETTPSTQVIVGEQIYGFATPPRLLAVYQAYELSPAEYWPSSRLVSARQNDKVAERRRLLIERLHELAGAAQVEGDDALVRNAQAYAQQLQQWPLLGAEWIGVTKINDSLQVQSGVNVERPSLYSSFNDAASNLQANPVLAASQYQLLPPKDLGDWQVKVVSPQGVETLAFGQNDTVRDVLKQTEVFAQDYDLAEVTLVSLTGLSRTSNVAYYNDAKDLPPVHGIIFVGLDLSAMDDEWQVLNRQLAALLSYWNPQS
ncbi:capsule biosynthesis GfcC family protein [Pseudidiomarina sediminum]|uniref:capsule biosynthesis GfcC family protein n=1 Tax=Pseudidiomarina sediminum TaxID=431675 RepID=UPI001C98B3D9|nr:capsule biosynthesis GfcC family protein [Pseudidiomarina sediminum]MBY6063756.1 hypothetical protein [Pseudidiomarina sediminum]